jgi:hypothetical protein
MTRFQDRTRKLRLTFNRVLKQEFELLGYSDRTILLSAHFTYSRDKDLKQQLEAEYTS